jgi:hypothetical protein
VIAVSGIAVRSVVSQRFANNGGALTVVINVAPRADSITATGSGSTGDAARKNA